MLAFLTKAGAQSDWLKWEIATAQAYGKRVLAVIEKGVPVPGFLLGIEHVVFDPTNPSKAIRDVATSLNRLKIERNQRQAVGLLVVIFLTALGLAGRGK